MPVLQLGVGLRKLGVNFSDDELAAFFTGCDQVDDTRIGISVLSEGMFWFRHLRSEFKTLHFRFTHILKFTFVALEHYQEKWPRTENYLLCVLLSIERRRFINDGGIHRIRGQAKG